MSTNEPSAGPDSRGRHSLWAALAGNTVLILGVLLLRWSAGAVLMLFWFENVATLIFAWRWVGQRSREWQGDKKPESFEKLRGNAFQFVFFTLVHGVFVSSIALMIDQGFAAEGGSVIVEPVLHQKNLPWAGPALVLLAAAAWGYYRRLARQYGHPAPGEETLTAGAIDTLVSRRVITLHCTIIFGFMLAAAIQHPVGLVITLVSIKFVADFFADYYTPGPGEAMQIAYTPRHEIREANPREYPRLDRGYYDQCQAKLESLGFHFLKDIEDVTLTRACPNMRTFLRTFLSRDGCIMAACAEVRPTGWTAWWLQLLGLMPRVIRMVNIETEFENGAFLCTANSKGLDEMEAAPEICKMQLPPSASIDELLALHRGLLAQWAAKDTAFRPRVFRSLAEAIESGQRQQALKSAFRKSAGGLSREEMQRIAGGKMTAEAEALLSEINEVAAGGVEVPRPHRGA